MRRILFGLAVAGVLLSGAVAFAITETQGKIGAGFAILKMTLVPQAVNGEKIIGGPQTYEVTKETVKVFEKMLKNGGTITVDGDGTLTIKGN